MNYRLMTSENPKIHKSIAYGYLSAGLFLRPCKAVCPHASKGCSAACLNTAGRGRFSPVQAARQRRTDQFLSNREDFCATLCRDIESLLKAADRKKLIPCLRLNGTSDIAWETLGIPEKFHSLQIYDYTKIVERYDAFLKGEFPKNYHLTFSRTEDNDAICQDFLKRGGNVAVVFDVIPDNWNGFAVVSGMDHDLRFTDPKGVIVGLVAKGLAKKDTTGFVVRMSAKGIA